MSYNYIPLADFDRTNKLETESKSEKVRMPDDSGYEFVRYGEGTVTSFVHEKCAEDIDCLLTHYLNNGYSNWVPRLKNVQFKRAVLKLRASLDVWELIPIKKVFTKDEIYFRCLQEGHAFTEFLKKCRSTTLRGLTTLTATEIEEEYFFPEDYEGYDSIFHERNLIHWDDKADVDDVKYAFMPYNGFVGNFEEICTSFLKSLKIDLMDFDLKMDTLGELRNTKMYDPAARRTALMREFWTEEIDLSQPYFARRSVVLTEPGSTRDAGVGDPSTIAKVKCINRICRTILERCTHSASAPSKLSTARLMRVLERNTYLHLDFKKYGLAFARKLQNIALSVIGHEYQINMEDLLIYDFFIEIDGEVYKTTRGTMLGWLDCLNEICVHAILWDLSYRKGLKFDWISFNDDVEISFYSPDAVQTERAEMMRQAVLAAFNQYDILISISKTYASKGCIFLEKYFRFKDKYDLDMQKRQLACKAYARSLQARQPWLAKLHFATGWLAYPNDEIATRCIATCPREFCKEEVSASLYVGGWYPDPSPKLDHSLKDQPQVLLGLGYEMTKISLPDLSVKPELVSSSTAILQSKIERLSRSKEPEDGIDKFSFTDIPYDVNFEAEGVFNTRELTLFNYPGRDGDTFPSIWNAAILELKDQAAQFDPGG